MNIVYSSDFGDIEVYDKENHIRAQSQRLMRYAIELSKIFGKKDMPREHTTSVEGIDLQKLCNESPEFKKIMDSGLYTLVDGKLCLYSPDIIRAGDDTDSIKLNPQVKESPEECCLTIASNSIEETVEKRTYKGLSFYHPEKSKDLQQNGVIADNFNLALRGNLAAKIKNDSGSEPTPTNMLELIVKNQIKAKKLSINRLSETIKVSSRTISRFWTDPVARPDLNSVIAVCIGLEMPPPTSDLVIELTGYRLRDIPLERVYRNLINNYYADGIQTCNQILIQNNLEALTAAT